MNYEFLYAEINEVEKKLNTAVADAKKHVSAMMKATDSGDLKALDKNIAEALKDIDTQKNRLQEIQNILVSFDRAAYIKEGTFKDQILAECKKQGVDAKETGGNVLELFPNRLVINEEAQDITVDKKRISCLRPSYLVSSVRKNQEKMGKASFNEQRFLDDVYTAYEAIIALETVKNTKKNKVISRSVKLTDIYKKMAPTARAKKDYDMLNFAYDISRVYSLDEKRAKNGMRMEIDTARGVDKNAIRILDAYGNEYFLTTIKFIENDL